MPRGVFRRVFFVGNFAVKVPRLARLSEGMRCNRWENEMYRVWRPRFSWNNLCPVLFADPLGLLLVMPRAVQPIDDADLDEQVQVQICDQYPPVTCELKVADFGRLNDKIVVLDYGLWHRDDVRTKRSYYMQAEPL